MLLGYILKESIEKLRTHSVFFVILLFLSLAGYFTGKFTGFRYLSMIVTDLSVLAFGASLIITGYNANDKMSGFFNERKRSKSFLKYVGGMALPVYLVQCFYPAVLNYYILQNYKFPLSLIIYCPVIWILGSLLYFISNTIYNNFHLNRFK